MEGSVFISCAPWLRAVGPCQYQGGGMVVSTEFFLSYESKTLGNVQLAVHYKLLHVTILIKNKYQTGEPEIYHAQLSGQVDLYPHFLPIGCSQ